MYIPGTKVPAGQHDWNQLSRNKTVLYVTASDVSRTENISSINRALRYSSTDVTLTQHHQPCQLTISVETVTYFSLLSNIFISTSSHLHLIFKYGVTTTSTQSINQSNNITWPIVLCPHWSNRLQLIFRYDNSLVCKYSDISCWTSVK